MAAAYFLSEPFAQYVQDNVLSETMVLLWGRSKNKQASQDSVQNVTQDLSSFFLCLLKRTQCTDTSDTEAE